jgi:hypothetical protein
MRRTKPAPRPRAASRATKAAKAKK